MTGLMEHLKSQIAETGAIDVATYMAECLSNPDHGYYIHNEPFGVSGDFITAPEVSQMFGELIGLWAVHQWHAMDKPSQFHLVELGPGRGTLMADALRAAQRLPEFADGMNLHLVETSTRLRAVQKQALAPYQPKWHSDIETLPEGPVIFIANEFFDALPVHQFEYTEHGWLERRIVADDGKLKFTLWPPQFSIAAATSHLVPRPGDIFETSPVSHDIAVKIAQRCVAHSGCALFIDYGHSASGLGDTLQAVKAHAYVDVLATPGDADLTAHVDFLALGKSATKSGAAVYGPVIQGDFLNALGIGERTEALKARATPEQLKLLLSGRDRLVNADQMGTLFKALAITSANLPAPSGFQST